MTVEDVSSLACILRYPFVRRLALEGFTMRSRVSGCLS